MKRTSRSMSERMRKSGARPAFRVCAACTIIERAAWRKIRVSRTTGAARLLLGELAGQRAGAGAGDVRAAGRRDELAQAAGDPPLAAVGGGAVDGGSAVGQRLEPDGPVAGQLERSLVRARGPEQRLGAR